MSDADTSSAISWTIHCDGTALPNPGRMGIGAVLTAPDGTRHTLSQATGMHGCNNEAEARALIAALRLLQNIGAENAALHIRSDSSVLVAQLGGAAPIVRLTDVFDEARQLLQQFGNARLSWVPRHRNSEADALARAALGLPSKAGVKPRPKKRRSRRK
ncbi:MAG TPA: ribonuclease HI family protein [Rhodocyclaceae bacterium]|nr:ribonuclease HI family protein [Rhodocyclaceae bacterium]